MDDTTKTIDASSLGAPAEAQLLGDPVTLNLAYDESSHATYSNLCRVTGTPEEVMMDFALNPNAFGRIVDEVVKIDHRIVMSYEAAKRTAFVLLETIRRHEERFGEVELDPRKRLRNFKEGS
ncbi:MAG TPA: DUF3467 domain-containing protein [Chthoniobacteraceae bacterium]|jgi:hypothetical protein|nr:DUF3467 domain-containing protein [Chthoniobacteraceae bacterium]